MVADKKLVNWVEKSRKKGYSDRELYDMLVKRGYSDKDIGGVLKIPKKTASIPAKQSVKQVPSNIKEARKSVVLIILTLSFLLSGVGNFYNGIKWLIGYIVGGSSATGFLVSFLGAIGIYFSVFLIIMGCLLMFTAWGLWSLKSWARTTAIVLTILMMLTIVGIPFGIIFLILLLRKKTKEMFSV